MEDVSVAYGGRFEIKDCLDSSYMDELSRDILSGLSGARKSVPSKYFYDERGSLLFERICQLSEYYLTRTEMKILEKFSPCIMSSFCHGDIVELGSGANWKIRTLLDATESSVLGDTRYVPVDISRSALVEASCELLDIYDELRVSGVVADFTRQMDVINGGRPKRFVFLGSTIGNFSEIECDMLLRNISKIMNPGDRFLVGLDMIKDKDTIEMAYNDSEGITAEFNKNVLSVINRELNGDFDLSHFDHMAFFNEERECVEMHLRANRNVEVEIGDLGLPVRLEEGETIHTEICRKFSAESVERMLLKAGLRLTSWYTDPGGWFSLVEAACEGNGNG